MSSLTINMSLFFLQKQNLDDLRAISSPQDPKVDVVWKKLQKELVEDSKWATERRAKRAWTESGTIRLVSKGGPGGIVWHPHGNLLCLDSQDGAAIFGAFTQCCFLRIYFPGFLCFLLIFSKPALLQSFLKVQSPSEFPCHVVGKAHVFRSPTHTGATLLPSAPVERHFLCHATGWRAFCWLKKKKKALLCYICYTAHRVLIPSLATFQLPNCVPPTPLSLVATSHQGSCRPAFF